jgi:hypothetical protein
MTPFLWVLAAVWCGGKSPFHRPDPVDLAELERPPWMTPNANC